MEKTYPPTNRLHVPLPFDRIELRHADGVEVKTIDEQLQDIILVSPKLAALKPVPSAVSSISGKPAIIYSQDDLEIPLTVDEYVGVIGRELAPDEFNSLRDTYGDAFDWRDDFYDPESGEALQPMGLRAWFHIDVTATSLGLKVASGMDGSTLFLMP